MRSAPVMSAGRCWVVPRMVTGPEAGAGGGAAPPVGGGGVGVAPDCGGGMVGTVDGPSSDGCPPSGVVGSVRVGGMGVDVGRSSSCANAVDTHSMHATAVIQLATIPNRMAE